MNTLDAELDNISQHIKEAQLKGDSDKVAYLIALADKIKQKEQSYPMPHLPPLQGSEWFGIDMAQTSFQTIEYDKTFRTCLRCQSNFTVDAWMGFTWSQKTIDAKAKINLCHNCVNSLLKKMLLAQVIPLELLLDYQDKLIE